MEQNKPPINKTSRFDRSDLLSILAVIVSLSALGVSVYEAGILREQSALMQEQQKAAVWPYMDTNANHLYSKETMIEFSFTNKGVGPAKIKSFDLLINGQTFSDSDEISAYFSKLIPNSESLIVSYSSMGGVVAINQ